MRGGAVEKPTVTPMAETVWQKLFKQAVDSGVTDIHIEPDANELSVRFRRHGSLTAGPTLSPGLAKTMAKHLKRLAGLELQQTKIPQTGTFTQLLDQKTYHVNLATIPVEDGERFTLHFFDQNAEAPSLQALGLWGAGLGHMQSALAQPHGLVLLTGPNHSGISTTLASCAAATATPLHAIASIEESAAYQLADVRYMNVNPSRGMTWPRVLRLQLKHEPNIVILGAMPDRPTSELAIAAARQRQLVIGGIRADSSLLGLTQLLMVHGDPLVVASCLRLISAQRLVQRLCQECREAYIPDHALIQRLQNIRNTPGLHALERRAAEEGLGEADELSTTNQRITRFWRAKSDGCKACRHTGYQGAFALFEIIPITDALRACIAEHAPLSELGAVAAKAAISLQTDGLIKALRGLIAVESIPGL